MISHVKVLRQKLLLTQVELAKELGLSKQMINNYEGRRNNLSIDVIKKIIELCDKKGIKVSAGDLFDNKLIPKNCG